MLSVNGSEFVVNQANDEQQWRERFSRAHELSHVLLLHLCGESALPAGLGINSPIYRTVERLCNIAAAEILVPREFLRLALVDSTFMVGGMDGLQDSFKVSKDTLLRRLTEALPNSCVLLWKPHQRHEREEMCFRVSRGFYRNGYKRAPGWLPNGCTTKHLSSDIVTEALERRRPIAQAEVTIKLGTCERKCAALAVRIHQFRGLQLSLFDDCPSESTDDTNAVVCIHDSQESTTSSDIWATWLEKLKQ